MEQVVILVNILSEVKTIGVEIEPSFCDYANQCAAAFKLTDVHFVNDNARNADYSEGAIFFMFTPFKDRIMEDVLLMLQEQSQLRKIKIITYEPCTTHVASLSWLESVTPRNNDTYKPASLICHRFRIMLRLPC